MTMSSMATLENVARPPNKLGSGLVASSSLGTIDRSKYMWKRRLKSRVLLSLLPVAPRLASAVPRRRRVMKRRRPALVLPSPASVSPLQLVQVRGWGLPPPLLLLRAAWGAHVCAARPPLTGRRCPPHLLPLLSGVMADAPSLRSLASAAACRCPLTPPASPLLCHAAIES